MRQRSRRAWPRLCLAIPLPFALLGAPACVPRTASGPAPSKPAWCEGFASWPVGTDRSVVVGEGGWTDPGHDVRIAGNRHNAVAHGGQGRLYFAYADHVSTASPREDHYVLACDDTAGSCAAPQLLNSFRARKDRSHARPNIAPPSGAGIVSAFYGLEGLHGPHRTHRRVRAPEASFRFADPVEAEAYQNTEGHGYVLASGDIVWLSMGVATRLVALSARGDHLFTLDALSQRSAPPVPPGCRASHFAGRNAFSKGSLRPFRTAAGREIYFLTWGYNFVRTACRDRGNQTGIDQGEVHCAHSRDLRTWTSCLDASVNVTLEPCASARDCVGRGLDPADPRFRISTTRMREHTAMAYDRERDIGYLFWASSLYTLVGPNHSGTPDCGSDCGALRGLAFQPGRGIVRGEFVVDAAARYDEVVAAHFDASTGRVHVWARRDGGNNAVREWSAPAPGVSDPARWSSSDLRENVSRCMAFDYHPCEDFPTVLVACSTATAPSQLWYHRRTFAD